jgi:hypothetical protein
VPGRNPLDRRNGKGLCAGSLGEELTTEVVISGESTEIRGSEPKAGRIFAQERVPEPELKYSSLDC